MRILILGWFVFISSPLAIVAAPPSSPFVAAFERFHRSSAKEPGAGGRLLLTELSCTACHVTADKGLRPKRGAILDGVGDRLSPAWLRKYLADPQAVKPGATMPAILNGLDGAKKRAATDALAAYLSTLTDAGQFAFSSSASAPISVEFWNKGDAGRGRKLFHRVGCVACHEPDPKYKSEKNYQTDRQKLIAQLNLSPEEIEELGLNESSDPTPSVPLGELPAKYSRKTFAFFVMNPLARRPAGRMPDLKLSAEEAADLAAYLIPRPDPPGSARTKAATALVAKGRELFHSLRCAECHAIKGEAAKNPAKPLADLDWTAKRQCVGEDPHPGLPYYGVDERQRAALRRAASRLNKQPKLTASNHADWTMRQLNCYACHDRGKRGGVGPKRRPLFETVDHVDIGDEGRIPPPLDHIGRKLQPVWLKKVFEGTGDVRPHMQARMPKFGSVNVRHLPRAFAMADLAKKPAAALAGGGTVEAGRVLLGQGCVQCHPLRGERMPGVMGIDLAGIAARIRPDWFRQFLLNPASLKPRTRMPTFFQNGKSANTELLAGKPDLQIASMWLYLNDNKQPLPEKLAQSRVHNFTVVPKDRPVLLRTFMKSAGLHAIAVGFPQRVHFSFDAERVRLSQGWKGGFLNAHGTWFDRFTPLAAPLGESVIDFPAGAPLARLSNADRPWPTKTGSDAGLRFRGYRLDKRGTPTMLYRFDGRDIEDRITPLDGAKGLARRLKISARAGGESSKPFSCWLRALAGKTLRRSDPRTYVNDAGLTASIGRNAESTGRVRTFDGEQDWIIPLSVADSLELEIQYRW